jgi:hypothetical protein
MDIPNIVEVASRVGGSALAVIGTAWGLGWGAWLLQTRRRDEADARRVFTAFRELRPHGTAVPLQRVPPLDDILAKTGLSEDRGQRAVVRLEQDRRLERDAYGLLHPRY